MSMFSELDIFIDQHISNKFQKDCESCQFASDACVAGRCIVGYETNALRAKLRLEIMKHFEEMLDYSQLSDDAKEVLAEWEVYRSEWRQP